MIFLSACGGAPRAPVEPAGPHLKVLTWNVNWAGAAWQEALAAIAEIDADVVLLQETNAAWEQAIRGALSSQYPQMRFDHEGGAGGMAVLTRQPPIAQKLLPPTEGWFGAWIVTAPTAVGPVQLLNVHLRPAISDRGSATISAYVETRQIREREVQAFAAHIDPDQPLIVAGDFNEGDGGGAIAWLRDEFALTNALPSQGQRDPTWRWKVAGVSVYQRLDHVLFSPHLRCADARVLRRGGSDHFPVVTTFVSAPDPARRLTVR